jgi:hypothetical protein
VDEGHGALRLTLRELGSSYQQAKTTEPRRNTHPRIPRARAISGPKDLFFFFAVE